MKRKKPEMTLAVARLLLILPAIAALLIGAPDRVQAKDPVNTDFWGIAIKGYDPVAYFTVAKPVKGSEEFEYRWQGAKWRFSRAENLELFKAEPEKYAPQYGGY
jgi:YHS domain-containing protein